MIRKLELFCQQRKPVTLTVGSPVRIIPARFRQVSESAGFVLFEILDPETTFELGASVDCTVIFVDGIRTSVFVGTLLSYEPEATPLPVLRISIPDNVVRTELRSTFRIPLQPESHLEVEISSRGRSWKPNPVDISIGGLLVEFPEDVSFDYLDDDDLVVELRLLDHRVQMEAMAQHRWDRFWAIYFSEVLRKLRHGDTSIPEHLRVILDRLESQWLADGSSSQDSPMAS